MKSTTFFGLCTALLLVVLCALAPARLLSVVIPSQELALQGVSGTLWRGVASRALLATGNGYFHLGSVQWSLSPVSLLTLSPRIEMGSAWGNQRFSGEIVWGGAQDLELSQVDAQVPAMLLKQFLPVELGGDFTLQLPELVLEQGLPRQGRGRLVWQDGAWMSPQGRRTLGSYALDFEQLPGEALVGEVITLNGEVSASGSIALEGREYSVDLLLSGPGLSDPQLRQALELVATPDGDTFRLRLEGALQGQLK